MEEVDALSDRIGIMTFGKMRCIGNSLHLKNRYGIGYTMKVVTDFDKSQQVIEQIKKVAPQAVLKQNDAGYLSYQISKENVECMPGVIDFLEENSEKEVEKRKSVSFEKSDTLIREWGVSHTSLEDVLSSHQLFPLKINSF